MRLQVTINLPADGPDAEPAEKWLESFRSWLQVVPAGVSVDIYDAQTLAYTDEFVTVQDLKDYFRPRMPQSRVPYNARMVFYWLVVNLHRDLEVRCAACRQRYLTCTCEASGYRKWGEGPNEWRYGDLTPDSHRHERTWLIGRRSLIQLPLLRLEQVADRSPARRERIKQFLIDLKGA